MVTVRFGERIVGGAEAHAREVALQIAARGHDVTVLTTCAEDYVTWQNTLPPGESRDGPLTVVRFPVATPRDLGRWEAAMQPILRGCWDPADEERVLREAGPDSPELLRHLRNLGHQYDAVVFFTLLYLPSTAGIPLVWDRAVLVPTLHDEVAVTLQAHGRALRLSRFLMWNTPEERRLAERMHDVSGLPGAVAGVGIAPPDTVEPQRSRTRFGLDRPFLLYAGRIDPDKGCDELLRFFAAWSAGDDRADLVLAGRAWMDLPEHPRIHHLGFVERDALWDLMAAASVTVVPSQRESLSMLALESLAAGTPILVRSGSAAVAGHVARGGAGLLYDDVADFAAAVELLLDRPAAAAQLGASGRDYVERQYSWPRIVDLYETVIDGVSRAARGTALSGR